MLKNPGLPLSRFVSQPTPSQPAEQAARPPAQSTQATDTAEDWPLSAVPAPVLPATEHVPSSTTTPPGRELGRGHPGVPGGFSFTAPSPGPATDPVLLPPPVKPTGIIYRPRKKKELRHQRLLEEIAAIDMEVRQKAVSIVSAYMGSADIDDEGPKPEGWTTRDHRVALDGRKPVKVQPGYLAAAVRIAESYQRAAAAKENPVPPSLSVDVQVFVKNETYNYPVVDVEDKER